MIIDRIQNPSEGDIKRFLTLSHAVQSEIAANDKSCDDVLEAMVFKGMSRFVAEYAIKTISRTFRNELLVKIIKKCDEPTLLLIARVAALSDEILDAIIERELELTLVNNLITPLSAVAKRSDICENMELKLFDTKKPKVLISLSDKKTTSKKVLTLIFKERRGEHDYAYMLANNPNTPEDILLEIAKSMLSVNIGCALLWNKSSTPEGLECLMDLPECLEFILTHKNVTTEQMMRIINTDSKLTKYAISSEKFPKEIFDEIFEVVIKYPFLQDSEWKKNLISSPHMTEEMIQKTKQKEGIIHDL